MEMLKKKMMELWNDEEGATMVEYGLMVALIAVICIAAVTLVGGNIRDMFTAVSGKIPTVIP